MKKMLDVWDNILLGQRILNDFVVTYRRDPLIKPLPTLETKNIVSKMLTLDHPPDFLRESRDAFGAMRTDGVNVYKISAMLSKFSPGVHFINDLFGVEEYLREMNTVLIASERHYNTLLKTAERDNGLSDQTRKALITEVVQNLAYLKQLRRCFDPTPFKKARSLAGYNVNEAVSPRRHTVWNKLICKIVKEINQHCHKDCDRLHPCRKTHEKALKYTAIWLRACFPDVWTGTTKDIANQIKQRIQPLQ